MIARDAPRARCAPGSPPPGGSNRAHTKPRLLDLYCGAGGAAVGYHRAGFDVIGVDINPQPNYPFLCWREDALDLEPAYMEMFDAIHASPPCQAYTTMNNRWGSDSPPLIDATRHVLEASGLPWVMENVTGARRAMRNPLVLHGGMFGLGVYRPRLFESNVLIMAPAPAPPPRDAAAVYGRNDGRRLWTRTDGTTLNVATLELAREAMGMPWADWDGIREAIPPAYSQFIGEQLLLHLLGVERRSADSSPSHTPDISASLDRKTDSRPRMGDLADSGSSARSLLSASEVTAWCSLELNRGRDVPA